MFCLTCQPRVKPSLPESAARTEDNSFAQPRPSSSRDFANARWVVRSLTLLCSWLLNAEEDEADDGGDVRCSRGRWGRGQNSDSAPPPHTHTQHQHTQHRERHHHTSSLMRRDLYGFRLLRLFRLLGVTGNPKSLRGLNASIRSADFSDFSDFFRWSVAHVITPKRSLNSRAAACSDDGDEGHCHCSASHRAGNLFDL
jgi:hypothetical protein